MPYTGYDPFGPQDPSGGGLDPSLYYALSAGGRFPGDYQNVLEYLAAQSRGTAGGNPDYEVPDWLEKFGKLGKLAGWHERNVQNGGEGQAPSPPGGYPYHFFSGPGASYGPPSGPLHGLVDQGRPGDPWDGVDRPPYVPQGETKPKKKGKGGGGGGGFNLVPTPYKGMQQGPSFVDWQPTQPFTVAQEPTRFVPGKGPPSPSSSLPPAAGGVLGTGGRGGGGGKGKGKGKGGPGGPGGPTGPGKGAAGKPGAPAGSGTISVDDLWEMILGHRRGDVAAPGSRGPGQSLRPQIGGGVDVNNLDKGTPGWMRDPTTGIANTGGFPGATPFGPDPGESFDAYLTRLHDAGFDSDSIGSLLGPNGFRDNGSGGWDWGWGTGPVIRGADGYQFANQGPGGEVTIGGGIGRPGGGAGGPGGGGAGGGGGDGVYSPNKPNAADYITGGVFSLPGY